MGEKEKIKADLVIHSASQLLTLRGFSGKPKLCEEMKELGIIEDGAIAIERDKIVWVGPTSDLSRNVERPNHEGEINASGKTVLPGLIDTHNHLIFAGTRENEFVQRTIQGLSYVEIAKRGGGVIKTVMATRSASYDALLALGTNTTLQMLRTGTATSEAKSGYGLNVADEVKMLEVIQSLDYEGPISLIPTFLAHGFSPEFKGREDEYVDIIVNEMIPEIGRNGLAKFCDVSFAPGRIFSEIQSEKILRTANEFGLKARVHGDEFTPDKGMEFAARVGAHTVDHCIYASEEGIEALRENKVIANLMPAVPFNLMTEQYANARKMIDSGVAVALGTDFNPSCFNHSMLFTIALACLKMKMTAEEAITAATINAAHSIGEAKNRGSLEVGKSADILIINAPNYIFIPYSLGSSPIGKIIKNGKSVEFSRLRL